MKSLTLSALAASMLFGLAGVVAAQQQGGQTQNKPGMDHSQMQGTDHSSMPGTNKQEMNHSNMPGMQGSEQGTRTASPAKPTPPNTTPQPRAN